MFNFLKTKTGKIIISLILGLGLSTLFRKSCHVEGSIDCVEIQYTGTDPNKIQKKTFKYSNNKCYKYKPFLAKCS